MGKVDVITKDLFFHNASFIVLSIVIFISGVFFLVSKTKGVDGIKMDNIQTMGIIDVILPLCLIIFLLFYIYFRDNSDNPKAKINLIASILIYVILLVILASTIGVGIPIANDITDKNTLDGDEQSSFTTLMIGLSLSLVALVSLILFPLLIIMKSLDIDFFGAFESLTTYKEALYTRSRYVYLGLIVLIFVFFVNILNTIALSEYTTGDRTKSVLIIAVALGWFAFLMCGFTLLFAEVKTKTSGSDNVLITNGFDAVFKGDDNLTSITKFSYKFLLITCIVVGILTAIGANEMTNLDIKTNDEVRAYKLIISSTAIIFSLIFIFFTTWAFSKYIDKKIENENDVWVKATDTNAIKMVTHIQNVKKAEEELRFLKDHPNATLNVGGSKNTTTTTSSGKDNKDVAVALAKLFNASNKPDCNGAQKNECKEINDILKNYSGDKGKLKQMIKNGIVDGKKETDIGLREYTDRAHTTESSFKKYLDATTSTSDRQKIYDSITNGV